MNRKTEIGSLSDRAKILLNLDQYKKINVADKVKKLDIDFPKEDLYILRLPISTQYLFGEIRLPKRLSFLKEFIKECRDYQENIIGIHHPFMYLTIRHGEIKSIRDDMWHVDGFSMRYNHLPEQNYIWSSHSPTEINEIETDLSDFDPLLSNIHLRFKEGNIKTLDSKTIYGLDPYVIHRRPPNSKGKRSFVRLSFTPIEIRDINNAINPLIKVRSSLYDGVKQFRNKLK